METAIGLETQTSIPGGEGNFAKGGSTGDPYLLHECLLAPQDFVLSN